MRKILLILMLLISSVAYSQKNYICAGTGVFFNSPISDWRNTMGANIEYGRYLKSGIAVGVSFGYWSFLKGTEFNGLKTKDLNNYRLEYSINNLITLLISKLKLGSFSKYLY